MIALAAGDNARVLAVDTSEEACSKVGSHIHSSIHTLHFYIFLLYAYF